MQNLVVFWGPIWSCFRDSNNYSGGPCFQAQIIGFYQVIQHYRNKQIVDIDWEAERDSPSNDDRESWVAEKNLTSPNYTEDGSGIPEVVGPVPPLTLYNTMFADTSLGFNMEVLSKRYKRTPADALSRVGPKDINVAKCILL